MYRWYRRLMGKSMFEQGRRETADEEKYDNIKYRTEMAVWMWKSATASCTRLRVEGARSLDYGRRETSEQRVNLICQVM